MCLVHAIVVEPVRVARGCGRVEQDRVGGVERDVRVEVVERGEEEGGRGGVRARVWRVLGLWLSEARRVSPRGKCAMGIGLQCGASRR